MNSVPFKLKLAKEVPDYDRIQKDDNANNAFNEELRSKSQSSPSYTSFMSLVTPTAESAATKPRSKSKGWFPFGGPQLPTLIEYRDSLLSKTRELNQKITNNASKALKDANKKVKDACDKAKAKWEAHKANTAIDKMNSDSKSSWQAID